MRHLGHLAADLRYTWRTLRAAPVFTTVAVLSIALGIGANAAIFTLVDQVLFRLLPVKDPQRLVMLDGSPNHYGATYGRNAFSHPMYADFRDRNAVFEGMFCRFGVPLQVGFGGRTERVSGELVSGSYFAVLGVGAAVGRVIGPDDDRVPGGHPVAVLSHAYWLRRFGGDPAIVGQRIVVNDQALTIIGVSAVGFEGLDIGDAAQIRVPVKMKARMTPGWDRLDDRRTRWVNAFGRLRPGVTREQAEASLQPIFRAMLEDEVKAPAFARASAGTKAWFLQGRMSVLPGAQGRSPLRSTLTRPLWVLMVLVAGVLLIACANVANLLVARAAARQREIAIRLALGASRTRVIQQLLTESLSIAAAGGVVGLLLAWLAVGPLLALLVPPEQQVAIAAAFDARLLAFAFGTTLVTAILFGVAPALQATRPRLAPALKDGAGSVAGGVALRLRRPLVVIQVAVSLVLMMGAGLFVRSVAGLMAQDPGFRTSNRIAFTLDPRLNGYTPVRARELFRTLRERLAALPGVESVGFAASGVINHGNWSGSVTVEGYRPGEREEMEVFFDMAGPGFFATLDIPLIAGRDFSDRDMRVDVPDPGSSDARVAIVGERFAKRFFPGGQAVGKRIGQGNDPGTPTPIEIVGVVKDAKFNTLREGEPYQVFLPYLEAGGGAAVTYVEARGEPAATFEAVRRVVRGLDPNLPIFGERTLERVLRDSVRHERLMASLSSAFGVLATLLAMMGLYGVLAYAVSRRTREIGIRMALGALTSHVSWLVLRDTVTLVAAGIALALPAAWWLGRYVESQLFGVSPTDPQTLAGAVGGLVMVAVLASVVPARRAARIDPVRALRQE